MVTRRDICFDSRLEVFLGTGFYTLQRFDFRFGHSKIWKLLHLRMLLSVRAVKNLKSITISFGYGVQLVAQIIVIGGTFNNRAPHGKSQALVNHWRIGWVHNSQPTFKMIFNGLSAK